MRYTPWIFITNLGLKIFLWNFKIKNGPFHPDCQNGENLHRIGYSIDIHLTPGLPSSEKMEKNAMVWRLGLKNFYFEEQVFQNPREASSWSRIFLISIVYLCICECVYLCMYLFVSRLLAKQKKRYRPEIWHTYSHWPYLKTGFFVFWSNPRDSG